MMQSRYIASIFATFTLINAYGEFTGPIGGLKITNNCNFDVPFELVPGDNDKYTSIATTIKNINAYPNNNFFQPWTPLSDPGAGWSGKIHNGVNNPACQAPAGMSANNSLLQYEYSWPPEPTTSPFYNMIWFDASLVNGWLGCNPFAWDCDECSSELKNVSYLYPENDEAMQPPMLPNITIGMILCPSGGPGSGASGSPPSSPLPIASAVLAPTYTPTKSVPSGQTAVATRETKTINFGGHTEVVVQVVTVLETISVMQTPHPKRHTHMWRNSRG